MCLMFDVSHDSRDFDCPKCAAGLTIQNWATEYGDLIPGEYEIRCPDCNHSFTVDVRIETKFTAW